MNLKMDAFECVIEDDNKIVINPENVVSIHEPDILFDKQNIINLPSEILTIEIKSTEQEIEFSKIFYIEGDVVSITISDKDQTGTILCRRKYTGRLYKFQNGPSNLVSTQPKIMKLTFICKTYQQLF